MRMHTKFDIAAQVQSILPANIGLEQRQPGRER